MSRLLSLSLPLSSLFRPIFLSIALCRPISFFPLFPLPRHLPLPIMHVLLTSSCRHIALVVLLRTETWQAKRGMIEYNLTFLRQGVRRILLEVEIW